MTLFYTNLEGGSPKSIPLQKKTLIELYIQNDNISTPSIRTPYFWTS